MRNVTIVGIFSTMVLIIIPIPAVALDFNPPITINNPNPSGQPDDFGFSVSLSDQFVVVGSSANIAYLFDKSGNLVQTFNNPAQEFGSGFGNSVSIDGDKVFIGARIDSSVDPVAGSAYLFDTSGTLLQTYNNPFGGLADEFGISVSISGEKVLVGAHRTQDNTAGGRAYLFDTSGNLLQTYNNPTPASFDRFGFSVSLSNDNVLIGAHNDDTTDFNAGSAYLFDTSGNLLQTYDNPFPARVARFGDSVSISGGKVLIGTPFFSGGPPGSAYLFDTLGNLLQTYNSPSLTGDLFGSSVSLSGENILIGAPNDNTGADQSGVVYLFDSSNNLLEIFNNPTPAKLDIFGTSVSLSYSVNVAVGAPGDDDETPNGGAAYLFSPILPPSPVGGELIPLDTTMVLVAGAQSTAAWMIPVIISIIGIGIVIARKF